MEILEELLNKKPEELEGESKRLFEAIMKIAGDRDKYLKELKDLKENYITKEKHKKALDDKDKHISKLLNDLTKQFDLTMRMLEDSLKLENTIDKIEDVLDDTNVENCDELVEGFLQIKSIIETTKILESEE